MKTKMMILLIMLLSSTSVFASEKLERKARVLAQNLPQGSGEVIVGIKTSKLFFSVGGLLLKDQTLAVNENVAVAGESKFYRVKKDSSSIVLSVCGAVLLMEPATREWSVPKNLDPNELVETVVIDSEGRSLDVQFYDHQVYQNYEHCNVYRF